MTIRQVQGSDTLDAGVVGSSNFVFDERETQVQLKNVFAVALGVRRENIYMADVNGLVHSARTDLNPYIARFAHETPMRTTSGLRGSTRIEWMPG